MRSSEGQTSACLLIVQLADQRSVTSTVVALLFISGWTRKLGSGSNTAFPRSNRLGLAQTRAPAFTRANDTAHALTHEVQARRSRDTRSGSPSRARYAGRSLHFA